MNDHRCRILIVEDNPLLRELYEAAIENLAVIVKQCGSVAEALDQIHKGHIDLLICDINLSAPKDGHLVVDQYLDQQDGDVLVVSGDGHYDAVAGQRVTFLRKPFTMASLIGAVSATQARMARADTVSEYEPINKVVARWRRR